MNRTDICNLALDHLREAPIGHIDAKGSIPEWFQRNFDAVLDGVLRDHPWNFAITPPKGVGPPAFPTLPTTTLHRKEQYVNVRKRGVAPG